MKQRVAFLLKYEQLKLQLVQLNALLPNKHKNQDDDDEDGEEEEEEEGDEDHGPATPTNDESIDQEDQPAPPVEASLLEQPRD